MKERCCITGGGTGIGASLARLMAANGHSVVITGRRLPALRKVADAWPDRIRPVQSDIANAADRAKLVDILISGDLPGYLVHNAAILQPVTSLKNMKTEEWRLHQAINVEGPLFLTRDLLPHLKSCRILNISSGAAHNAYPGWGAYCVSKAALFMMYKVFREEFKDTGILFGSLRPGIVDTPMQDLIRTVPESDFPYVQKFIEYKENGQLEDPDMVARFIKWVLTETSDALYSRDEWDVRDETYFQYWR